METLITNVILLMEFLRFSFVFCSNIRTTVYEAIIHKTFPMFFNYFINIYNLNHLPFPFPKNSEEEMLEEP